MDEFSLHMSHTGKTFNIKNVPCSEENIRVTLNSIIPNRVQHILRHNYKSTMEKLCKFDALYSMQKS